MQGRLEKLTKVLAPELLSQPASVCGPDSNPSLKRGGELVSGPRRHPKFRSDVSRLCMAWRKELTGLARIAQESQYMAAHTLKPVRSSTHNQRLLSSPGVPTTIDELFQRVEYKGQALECMVVSVPVFTGSASIIVIEDSQREPARVAMYKVSLDSWTTGSRARDQVAEPIPSDLSRWEDRVAC